MTTIDQIIAEKISSWYIGDWPMGNLVLCSIAMLLSVILCGAIGMEREWRGRTAGLRTHLLVGVGSCIVMIISIYGFPAMFQEKRDVARLAAQVITGVGFLGAGAIIHRNSGTRGLTTAATIWLAMAIGLACGSMNFVLAAGGTILILVVLILFRKVEKTINRRSPLIMVRGKPSWPLATFIIRTAEKFDATIHDLHVEILENYEVEATFLVECNSGEMPTNEFVMAIEEGEGVLHAGVINGHKY